MNQYQISLGRTLMKIRPAPLAALLKFLLMARRIERATSEGKFWIDPASYQGQAIANHGIYEPDMLATIKTVLQANDTFIDLGANEGYFSVVASTAVGPAGAVVAIEPQTRLRPVLQRNFDLNGCTNARIVSAAVSDQRGTTAIHLTPSLNNSASSLVQPTRYPLFRQKVSTFPLEEIADQFQVKQCRLLKIDIEGWEYEAILGSRKFFQARRADFIALELHPHLLAKRSLEANDILAFLHECGYREQTTTGHLLLGLA